MKIFAFIFVALLGGFSFGYWFQKSEDLQWATTDANENRMPAEDEVPCPSPENAAAMVKKYKISFNLDNWSCAPEDTRTHFLKALSLAKKFSFTPNKDWDPKFREAVMNLEDWLPKYTESYNIDTVTADTTLAYYKPTDNKTFMTERIKNFSAQEVFSIIVHENRHAEAPSISHVFCISGDFPLGEGACDQEFTDKWADMGAYNFAALFEIGNVLYNEKLKPQEKDVLAISALNTISNRLNVIPPRFGYFHETLAFLDDRNSLYLLNPLTLQPDLIKVDENIDHIENASAQKFSIFTKNGRWLSWDLFKGVDTKYAEILKGKNILDGQRSRVFSQNQILDTYSDGGRIQYLDFDSVTKKKTPRDFALLKNDQMRNDIQRIIFGEGFETVFITKTGQLLRARQYGNEPAFSEIESSGASWLQGTSGPLYNALYFANTQGSVQKLSIAYAEDETETNTAPYQAPNQVFTPVNDVSSLKVQKYYPGVNGVYVLNQSMSLLYRPYGRKQFTTLRLPQKITDFVVIKNFSPSQENMKARLALQKDFETKCNVKTSTLDPWTSLPMGIDANQNLIISSLSGECQRIAMPGAVLSYKVANRAPKSKNDDNLGPYSRPVLIVTTEAGTQVLNPYTL